MKVNMNIMKKSMTGAFLALAAVSTGNIEPMEACTRAVYIGPEQMVINRPYDGLERRHYVEHLRLSSWNETSRIQQGRNRELDL